MKFADLNILHDVRDPKSTLDKVEQAIELGYDCISVNTEIGDFASSDISTTSGDSSKGPSKKGKRKANEIPEPFLVKLPDLDLTLLQTEGRQFHQYSRITAILNESGDVHAYLSHPTVLKYDIIAAIPMNEAIFNAITKRNEIDLITFDIATKPSWLNKSKLLRAAIENGSFIEISYSGALTDSSSRRQVLSNAREIWRISKGKQVILSSRCESSIDLRGPYDAANLGILFGAPANKSLRMLRNNCELLIRHSTTRKTLKGAIHFLPLANVKSRNLEKLMKIPEFRAEIEKIPEENSQIHSQILNSSKNSKKIEEPPKKKSKKS